MVKTLMEENDKIWTSFLSNLITRNLSTKCDKPRLEVGTQWNKKNVALLQDGTIAWIKNKEGG